MNMKYPDLSLWVCFIILLLLGLGACVYSAINPAFNAVSVLSGYATFAIALLTVVYVVTTRHQLRIMIRQLGTMMRAQELQAQPLPWPISIRVFSERPQLFYSPYETTSGVVALIRHFAKVRIRNLGTSPAVSVDISCRLSVPTEAKPIDLSAVSVRAEVIEDKHEFPEQKYDKDFFQYSEDTDGSLLTAILGDKIDMLPQLHIHILYRNALGGCFQLRRAYKLYPETGTSEILKNWLERIRNFSLCYEEDLNLLSLSRSRMDQREGKTYKDLYKKLQEGLSGKEIDYDVFPMPASGEVSSLTSDEYAQAVRGMKYGFLISSDYHCPFLEQQEECTANDAIQRIGVSH